MENERIHRIGWMVILIFFLIILGLSPAVPSANMASQADTAKVDPALIDIAERGLVTPLRLQATAVREGKVRVILDVDSQEVSSIIHIVEGFEAVEVEKVYRGLIQTWVPRDILKKFYRKLAGLSAVNIIQLPVPSIPAVTSQGVEAIDANAWHEQGIMGEGVKVAVIDHGFVGYRSLLGNELPPSSSVKVKSFREDGDITGGNKLRTNHGTACAEIAHDVAPDAYLYLVNFETRADLGYAVDWLIEEDVDVISLSITFQNGRYDGNSLIDKIVHKAYNHGILWVTAAGNYAKRHWGGDWVDYDGDKDMDFRRGDDTQDIKVRVNEDAKSQITVGLSWNDPWRYSSNDYDLYLYDSTGNLVGDSEAIQNGRGYLPAELINVKVSKGGTYQVKIKMDKATRDAHLELFTPYQDLEYQVPSSSIMSPGNSPHTLTVGAIAWENDKLRDYSSRGPTNDGRTKPDLTAPDGVRTKTYDKFYGTSASTPHVAGAAALVKQANNPDSPSEIKEYLTDQAEDLGLPGKDNSYGSGRVDLGESPEFKPLPEQPLEAFLPQEVLGRQLSPAKEGYFDTQMLKNFTVEKSSEVTCSDCTGTYITIAVFDMISKEDAKQGRDILEDFFIDFTFPSNIANVRYKRNFSSGGTGSWEISKITTTFNVVGVQTKICERFNAEQWICLEWSRWRNSGFDGFISWNVGDLLFAVRYIDYSAKQGLNRFYWELSRIAETTITMVTGKNQFPSFPSFCECDTTPFICDFDCTCDPDCDFSGGW